MTGSPYSGFYQACNDVGGMSAYAWDDDPKRLAFTLARYKHTAKILAGYDKVLEIGCSDGYASRIVSQHVGSLKCIDIDAGAIELAKKKNNSEKWPITFEVYNPEKLSMFRANYDACYLLDVLEHIQPHMTPKFLDEVAMIAPVCVIGMPSLESQVYASKLSQEGHVNCRSGDDLKRILKKHWKYVFVFTMHDETLGTSYYPMAHYLLALCIR